MKKRFISLILICLLTLQLVGCGPAAEPAPAQAPVTMLYSIDLTNFETLVEDTYPDIDLQIELNAKATIDGESERRLRTATAPISSPPPCPPGTCGAAPWI